MSNSDKNHQSGQGLYEKYNVTENGDEVSDCFILEPETDEDARKAIHAYADATDNENLADDLRAWMDQLEAKDEE
mgnify:CR=1 FL=1